MSEEIGSIKPTQIPSYEDDADIKAALRLYHYGQDSVPATEDVPAESVVGYLLQLESDIAALEAASGIQPNIVDAKGDLIVAKGDNLVDNLPVGNNNEVLIADSSTSFGVKWGTATDLVSSASTTSAGKVQLNDTLTSTSTSQAATANAAHQLKDLISNLDNRVTDLSETFFDNFKTANYTLEATDAGQVIIMNIFSGTSIITVPTQASGNFKENTRIDIISTGSIQTEISPASGVVINSKFGNKKLSTQYSAAVLVQIADDNWILIGDLTA